MVQHSEERQTANKPLRRLHGSHHGLSRNLIRTNGGPIQCDAWYNIQWNAKRRINLYGDRADLLAAPVHSLGPLPSVARTTYNVSRKFARQPRPESGRDCLICAMLTRQRPHALRSRSPGTRFVPAVATFRQSLVHNWGKWQGVNKPLRRLRGSPRGPRRIGLKTHDLRSRSPGTRFVPAVATFRQSLLHNWGKWRGVNKPRRRLRGSPRGPRRPFREVVHSTSPPPYSVQGGFNFSCTCHGVSNTRQGVSNTKVGVSSTRHATTTKNVLVQTITPNHRLVVCTRIF